MHMTEVFLEEDVNCWDVEHIRPQRRMLEIAARLREVAATRVYDLGLPITGITPNEQLAAIRQHTTIEVAVQMDHLAWYPTDGSFRYLAVEDPESPLPEHWLNQDWAPRGEK